MAIADKAQGEQEQDDGQLNGQQRKVLKAVRLARRVGNSRAITRMKNLQLMGMQQALQAHSAEKRRQLFEEMTGEKAQMEFMRELGITREELRELFYHG